MWRHLWLFYLQQIGAKIRILSRPPSSAQECKCKTESRPRTQPRQTVSCRVRRRCCWGRSRSLRNGRSLFVGSSFALWRHCRCGFFFDVVFFFCRHVGRTFQSIELSLLFSSPLRKEMSLQNSSTLPAMKVCFQHEYKMLAFLKGLHFKYVLLL